LDRKDVIVGMSGQSLANVIGHTIYVQTTNGAPKGKIAAADVSTPGKDHWKDLVPERRDAVIQAVAFGKGTIAVTYLKNAANVIEVFDLSGKSIGVINQPGIGASGLSAEEDRNEAYLTFTSFNQPTTIFRVDLTKPGVAPELWERPEVPVDPSIAEVEQV